MAEQFLEVPTPFYFFAQNADIPVPRGRGARERSVEQIVDPSVPGRVGFRGPQGLHPRQSSVQRTTERSVDIPVPGRGVARGLRNVAQTADFSVPGRGGHPDFLPEQVSTAFSGSDHRHGTLHGGGPQGSVRGQGSTALSRDAEEEEQRMMILNPQRPRSRRLAADLCRVCGMEALDGSPSKEGDEKEEEEEEEEADHEDSVAPVPGQLLLMMTLRFSPQCDMACSVSWRCVVRQRIQFIRQSSVALGGISHTSTTSL